MLMNLVVVGSLTVIMMAMATSAERLLGVKSGDVNCSEIQIFPDLDLEKYAGDWYIYLMYPNYPSGIHGFCGKFCYVYVEDTGLAGNFTFYRRNDTTQHLVDRKAWLEPYKSSGLLTSILGPRNFPFSTTYYVLDTDYVSYSFVYSCRERQEGLYDFAFILTRVEDPPEDLRSKLAVMVENMPPIIPDLLTDVRVSC